MRPIETAMKAPGMAFKVPLDIVFVLHVDHKKK